MAAIKVNNLSKEFKVFEKEAGFLGSIKSLVNRKFNLVRAVSEINFQIEEGELVGFIGPNGAGKTTTLKCLSGLLYPSRGNVSVLGFTPFERKYEFLKQIALVMGQKNQLWWDLPPIDSFLLNKEIYEVSDNDYQNITNELIGILDVGKILKTQVRKLSLGERMKCELIASLIHKPKILFLDEPTIGLDVVMQKALRDFVRDYNAKYHSTVLLTSHNMDDVKELCKRVLIIDKGKLIFDGELNEIVTKFADHKIISVLLDRELDRAKIEELSTLTEVKEYNFPKLVVKVRREKASIIAGKILSEYQVKDIDIQESAIEDIIREVFSGKDLA